MTDNGPTSTTTTTDEKDKAVSPLTLNETEPKDNTKTDTATTSSSQQHDNNNENDTVNPISDFVTTSYVLNTINAALEDTMKDATPTTSSTQKQRFFELQKRMPDGSTRPATDEEVSSVDMKQKLEQAAQLTSQMTLEQKWEWAHKQRQVGNQLYQDGQYKEAIDIYLTCLVVRDTTNKDTTYNTEAILLPVMNNLAQCALQLGWYHKAELFCTLALEALDDKDSSCTSQSQQAVSKLYFKRGKARRLRGWYEEAKKDLEHAMETLTAAATTTTTDDNDNDLKDDKNKSAEQKAIEREFQLLAKAVAEAKKNKKRAQRAMQKVLGSSDNKNKTSSSANTTNGNGDDKVKDTSPLSTSKTAATRAVGKASTNNGKQTPSSKIKETPDTSTPLYHEKHVRTHSTIRRRPEGPPSYPRTCIPVELSYWQLYRLIIARVAQRLLDIIGDEEGEGELGTLETDETPATTNPGPRRRPKQD